MFDYKQRHISAEAGDNYDRIFKKGKYAKKKKKKERKDKRRVR